MKKYVVFFLMVLSIFSTAKAQGESRQPADVGNIVIRVVGCDVSDLKPNLELFIRASAPTYPRIDIHPTFAQKSDGSLVTAFPISPGTYIFTLIGPNFRIANPLSTILPGQTRHLPVFLCKTMISRDSERTVAGTLPFDGLSAVVMGKGYEFPVAVDGGAYYADTLPLGKLTLRFFYPQGHDVYCDFVLPGSANESYQHIIFDVTLADLRIAHGHKCDGSR